MAPYFVTLGMFIIDDFSFADELGNPIEKTLPSQIGGGGTYAAVGARLWLPPSEIGMVVDKGKDFPASIQQKLLEFGEDMWLFREQPDCLTTRALNSYTGDHRNFDYMTPRIRITPKDIFGTKVERPATLHFICSPTRAAEIMSEVKQLKNWAPITIYEPIPYRCIPDELPALKNIIGSISILSPNAEEVLSLLSMPLPPTRTSVEQAAQTFLDFGIGSTGSGCVIVRSGHLGAYVKIRSREGLWIDAYWTVEDRDKVVDVTGAGNSFLGGVAAGLLLANNDVYEASFYGAVSASFIIEQEGVPVIEHAPNGHVRFNADDPTRRLEELHRRHNRT